MSTATTLSVGDKVIYVKCYGTFPETDNVASVTKAGWIKINLKPGHFKPNWKNEYKPTGFVGSDKARDWVVAYSDETYAELTKVANEAVAAQQAEREEQANRLKAAEEQQATELAEVKAAVGGSIYSRVRYQETMPNGDRLVLLHLPVKASLAPRKGPVQVALVRLCNEQVFDFAASRVSDTDPQKTVVRAYSTYADASTSSFPSISGTQADTDEECLWQTARYLYHGW